ARSATLVPAAAAAALVPAAAAIAAAAAPIVTAAAGVAPVRTATIPAARATAAAAARWAVQHGQRSAHASDHHFGGVTVIAVAVLPFAGAQIAFDIDFAALFQKAFHHADQAVTIDDDAVPFGALLALARHAVFPLFRRGNAQIGDF